MNTTIIGTGNMARGIAERLLAGGNNVSIISRDEKRAQETVAELSPKATGGATVRATTTVDGEIIVLATPYTAAAQTVQGLRSALAGKIIVDITNPIDFGTMQIVTPPGRSGAEEIAAAAPTDAHVVKAFNCVLAGTLSAGKVDGKPLDVMIAGDDEVAKKKVAAAISSGGMRPIDVGALKRSLQLEGLALLFVSIQDQLDKPWQSALQART